MKSNLAGRNILVIGGSGFIGRHVSRACLNSGAKVRVFDVVDPKIDGVDFTTGDFKDFGSVRAAANGCNTAIFLGASGLPSTPVGAIHGQITDFVSSVVTTAQASFNEGVGTFVFASSGGTVYGANGRSVNTEDAGCRPITIYGASKLACEGLLTVLAKAHGANAVSLRVSNAFGEGHVALDQGFIAAAMQRAISGERLSIWGDGTVVRDYIYVGDVADAFVKACAYRGSEPIFNIGSGRGCTLIDVIQAIEQTLGYSIETEYAAPRSADIAVNILDISLARQELGWAPQIELDEGLRRTAAWWRDSDRTI